MARESANLPARAYHQREFILGKLQNQYAILRRSSASRIISTNAQGKT